MSTQINPEIELSKVCPDCGRELTIRENRQNGSQFFGLLRLARVQAY